MLVVFISQPEIKKKAMNTCEAFIQAGLIIPENIPFLQELEKG